MKKIKTYHIISFVGYILILVGCIVSDYEVILIGLGLLLFLISIRQNN